MKRLRPSHWAWMQFKIIIGIVWPILLLPARPIGITDSLGVEFLSIAAVLSIIGASVATVGIVMTAQPEGIVRLIGLSIELIGLCFFAALPFTYCLTELLLFLNGDEFGLSRLALAALSYGILATIATRAAILLPVWSAESHDERKKV